jgi:hypothetical protein
MQPATRAIMCPWKTIMKSTPIDWQKTALKNGWIVLEKSRQNDDGYTDRAGDLWHEGLDRMFPTGDWEGAVRDLDLDEEDIVHV